jgi:hypothetical protein
MITIESNTPIITDPSIEDFVLELLDRLGIDSEDLDPDEFDELVEYTAQYAQSYWVEAEVYDPII